MNRPLRNAEFDPYRPITEGAYRRVIRASYSHTNEAVTGGEVQNVGDVFDAKENLRTLRSSILSPGTPDPLSLAMAERIVSAKRGPIPSDQEMDELAFDLSKFVD